MIHGYHYQTLFGPLWITADGTNIIAIELTNHCPEDIPSVETPLIRETIRQLTLYFKGELREFDLPLNPAGTPFQKTVWEALRRIPYGETRSYRQIAEEIENPAACRAVGMANHRNPIMIVVPCHRVVGADGSLTGYAGGMDKKRFLLDLEQGPLLF